MPRHDQRLQLREQFSRHERVLLEVVMQLVNPLRLRLQLPPLTQSDLVQLVKAQLHSDREN